MSIDVMLEAGGGSGLMCEVELLREVAELPPGVTRWDVDWSTSRASVQRVHRAMVQTDARYVARPERVGCRVIVATIETSQPEKWRDLARPLVMRSMTRATYKDWEGKP